VCTYITKQENLNSSRLSIHNDSSWVNDIDLEDRAKLAINNDDMLKLE
jgi:hypothetical protein